MTYREPTGEARWAKFDQQEVRIRQGQHVHEPDWKTVYIYLLEIRDYDSAALVLERNKISDECDEGDHDECFFSWCVCDHHSEVQFRLEHPQIRSLSEAHSEEQEAA